MEGKIKAPRDSGSTMSPGSDGKWEKPALLLPPCGIFEVLRSELLLIPQFTFEINFPGSVLCVCIVYPPHLLILQTILG